MYNEFVSNQHRPPFLIDQQDELSVWRFNSFYDKEPETIKWINFFATSKMPLNFLDIGANIGMYSLYFLSLAASKKVICVEPFQKNFNLLTQNLLLNNYKDRAKVIDSPLSREVEFGSAIIADERPGGSGYKLIKDDGGNQDSIDVQIFNIDSILFPFNQKYVIKIDTDGNDFEILQGGIKSLQSGCIISILIEASQSVQKQINNYLKSFNFELDYRFNDLSNHSDRRRIASNKEERNRIYTRIPLIY